MSDYYHDENCVFQITYFVGLNTTDRNFLRFNYIIFIYLFIFFFFLLLPFYWYGLNFEECEKGNIGEK